MLVANFGSVRMEYPENWEVMMPKQKRQSVVIAPQVGITENDVGYGVVVGNVALPNGEQKSIDDITHQLVQDMEQNETLQPVGEARPVTHGGIQGRAIVLQSVSPFPAADGKLQKERDWLFTVPQADGSVIFMIFVAPDSQFDHFKQTFEAMLKSVQFK